MENSHTLPKLTRFEDVGQSLCLFVIRKCNLAVLLLMLATASIDAQPVQRVKAHLYDLDQKHYSTETVPGSDDYVMAGTIYNGSDYNSIHFLYFTGNTLTLEKTYSSFVEGGSANDLRVVDIAVTEGADGPMFYITALLRHVNTPGEMDMVKLLCVDASGNILLDKTFTSNASQNNNYDHMYPLHSIVSDNMVYICGYVHDDSYFYPKEPTYIASLSANPGIAKKAFVLRYNPSNNTVLSRFYDSQITTNPVSTDYDIAMRMVPLSNGDIFVTGSANAAVNISGVDHFNSGTLVLPISPATLLPTVQKSFVNSTSFFDPNYGEGEYGVGIIEGTNNDYFVISNYFTTSSTSQTKFYPNPQTYCFTNLDNSFVPGPGGLNRATSQLSNTWMLQNLPGSEDGKYLVAGMTISSSACNAGASFSNANPILEQIAIGFVGGTVNVTPDFFNVYTSTQGTGGSGFPNNYIDLGAGLSNIAWNPTFATRDYFSGTNDIIMNAPMWNSDVNKLNYKFVRTDNVGVLPPDCDFYVSCSPTYFSENADDATIGTITNPIIQINNLYHIRMPDIPLTVGDIEYYAVEECNIDYHKTVQLGVSNTEDKVSSIKIYPNPASGHISLSLSGISESAVVEVKITNLLGIDQKTIYNGLSGDLNAKTLSIRDIPAGVYLVDIQVENGTHHTRKLVIY